MTTAEQMQQNAAEAMKLTRKYFVEELDYSVESLAKLDRVAGDIDFAMPKGSSEESLSLLERTWGSYLGEVLCRHAGGTWTDEIVDGFPAVQVGDKQLRPHSQVRRRLTDGMEQSLVAFYAAETTGD